MYCQFKHFLISSVTPLDPKEYYFFKYGVRITYYSGLLLFEALYIIAISIKLLSLVLQSLVALIHDPEPEHPLRGDLAEEYLKDKKKFMKTAEDQTKKFAEKRPTDCMVSH